MEPKSKEEFPSLEISILMPCLNEEETLRECIQEAKEGLKKAGNPPAEIIISDNGSTDASHKIAREEGVRLLHVDKRGYGNALRAGANAAKGKYILMADSDQSYDFREIPRFLKELHKESDLVMGCRLPSGGGTIEEGAMPWKNRWIGNPALSLTGKILFRTPIHDFHCGIRAFSKEAFQKMELETTGMEFATEMVAKASILELKISEVPVTLRKDGRSRPPHLRPWHDGWRHLRFMFQMSPRWAFIIPGSCLFILGIFLSTILAITPISFAGVNFDIHTLLVALCATTIGYQAILFGAIFRIHAFTTGLLPNQPQFSKLLKAFNLETGIATAFLLALIGGLLILIPTFQWIEEGLGDLSPQETFRAVAPGCTLVTLGVQTFFASLLASALGMSIRKAPPKAHEDQT